MYYYYYTLDNQRYVSDHHNVAQCKNVRFKLERVDEYGVRLGIFNIVKGKDLVGELSPPSPYTCDSSLNKCTVPLGCLVCCNSEYAGAGCDTCVKTKCSAPTPPPTPLPPPSPYICDSSLNKCNVCPFCCKDYYSGWDCDPCVEAKCQSTDTTN